MTFRFNEISECRNSCGFYTGEMERAHFQNWSVNELCIATLCSLLDVDVRPGIILLEPLSCQEYISL